MYRRPDVVVYDKKTKKVTVIDIAVPGDVNVVNKERGKRERYPGSYQRIKKDMECKDASDTGSCGCVLGTATMLTKVLEF